MIVQNVNYEIPCLKKQLERARKINSVRLLILSDFSCCPNDNLLDQHLQDQLRRQADCRAQSRAFRDKYVAACGALGIKVCSLYQLIIYFCSVSPL